MKKSQIIALVIGALVVGGLIAHWVFPAKKFGSGVTSISSGTISSTSTVISNFLQGAQSTTFTSTASSQALCTVRNNSGVDRVLDNVALIYATSSATGGIDRFTISQSATVAATGSSPYFDNSVSSPTNGINNLTTTSTLSGTGGAKDIWLAGQYINFLIASPTTTLSGSCRVSAF